MAAAANKNFYHREIVAQDSEDNITRLSESVDGFVTPLLVSKDAIPPRYKMQRWFSFMNIIHYNGLGIKY